MKSLTLILFILILSDHCFPQQIIDRSDNRKPTWFSGNNKIESDDFDYYVSQGTSYSLDTAQKNAIQNVLIDYAQSLGSEVSVIMNSTYDIKNSQRNDSVKTTSDFRFSGKVQGKEQNFRIPCFTVVEYYWEKELYNGKPQYQYWILVRIPRKERDCYAPFYKSYGKSAVWRSAILPGWGQMHLGYKTRGTILLTSTAILLSGITTSQIMYVNNWNNYTNSLKLGRTDDARVYKSNSDDWYLIRNINLVALGGVYVFNIVDALTKKGVNIYASNDGKVKISPAIGSDYAMLTLKVKF